MERLTWTIPRDWRLTGASHITLHGCYVRTLTLHSSERLWPLFLSSDAGCRLTYWMSFLVPNEHFCASTTGLLLQLFNSTCHFLHYYGFESLFAAGNRELVHQRDMKCSARLLVPTIGALSQSSNMVCMCLSLQVAFSIYFLGNLDSCFCFVIRGADAEKARYGQSLLTLYTSNMQTKVHYP